MNVFLRDAENRPLHRGKERPRGPLGFQRGVGAEVGAVAQSLSGEMRTFCSEITVMAAQLCEGVKNRQTALKGDVWHVTYASTKLLHENDGNSFLPKQNGQHDHRIL